jgi:hypothetical protein
MSQSFLLIAVKALNKKIDEKTGEEIPFSLVFKVNNGQR